MIPELESDSGIRIGIEAWFVGIGIGIGTHDAGIGNRIGIEVFWETLESEPESESLAAGIRIGNKIMDSGKPWNRNQNLNQP
mgnify:CR=1 FL=1